MDLTPQVIAALRAVRTDAPYSTYVRRVIIDRDRGVMLTGRTDSALLIEG